MLLAVSSEHNGSIFIQGMCLNLHPCDCLTRTVFDSSKVTIKSVLEPAVLFSTPAEECRKHIWQRPANLFSAPVQNAQELSLSYSVKNSLIIWEL